MARVIEVSIKERADEVVALFNANRPADAVALLERHRQGQPEVVQESMDRYVSTQAERSIAASAERAQVSGHPGRPIGGGGGGGGGGWGGGGGGAWEGAAMRTARG
ncbi:hypothetical protein EIQ27_11025 [Xanthomonas campestris pv. armoraciae]